ncbi:MAG: HlyD family efflux transporter periplasmic adaptor subunit, partial [Acidobacteriota bacterium]|nr:HlyD family efflux transporter periplasmic adaptor subunit [Acidobacteriota bacterium]
TVRAPRGGFVVHVPDENGGKVKVGESVWQGRQIVELADLGRMEVAAEVAEPDAGFVAVGQSVEIRLDASPDRRFRGRVEKLGRLFHPRASEDPSMVFDAVVSIDETDPELMRPGMAAKLRILSESGEPVIQIPEAAIRSGQGGPTVAVRKASGKVKTVPVELGPRWRGTVVVTGGLEEGDAVELPRDS